MQEVRQAGEVYNRGSCIVAGPAVSKIVDDRAERAAAKLKE